MGRESAIRILELRSVWNRRAKFFPRPVLPIWQVQLPTKDHDLIRQYLPKGTSMRNLTQEQCDWIADELNDRLRERHQFRTPSELFL